MGCDGGTIPRRDELVRLKKKPEQKDKDADRSFKWRNCALSQQRLQEPLVACGLGRLYSKSCILEALLDKESKPESISHIKSLKDVKNLNPVKNPAYTESERLNGAVDEGSAPYMCPISGLEMTGKFRFVSLWSCGCVLAERALKHLQQNICHLCQTPYTEQDVVVLNGTEDDIEKLKINMANRNASRKSNKKSKTVKTQTEVGSTSTSTSESQPLALSNDNLLVKTEPEDSPSIAVKQEIETIPLKLPKYNKNKIPRGPFGSTKRAHSNDLLQDPAYKKTKQDYSVAKDPKVSEVYKSIFTSHKDDKEQPRAHWVTYNPFYN